jgi:hypothetical protein
MKMGTPLPPRLLVLARVLLACACLIPAAAAVARAAANPSSPGVPTSATIVPSLSASRPGARAALTVAIHYAGGATGVPSPVRRSLVRFPEGMTLDIPHLRSCSPARLLAHGPSGCPAQSALGRGSALAEIHGGALILKEHIALWAFLGAPRDGWATVEILGEGVTPQQRRMVVTGTMRADVAPYGEALEIPFPPIPTLPQAPDASLVSFSLTIGATGGHHGKRGVAANTVVVPGNCPAGGLPFAAEFTYADGSTGSAAAAVPCARAVAPRVLAEAARTISFQESGQLHLLGRPHGFTLYERGSASGTAAGTIYVRLTAVSTGRVTAEVNIYPKGGSITGYATAGYHTGSTANGFSGSMNIARGSGSYAHVHGSGLSFSGTIERSNDAVTVRVSGRLSD